MDRREFLTSALVAAVAGTTAVRAQAGARGLSMAAADAAAHDPELVRAAEAALDCMKTGDACIRHCVDLLGQGDTTLSACMRTVLDMRAVCDGLARLASYATTTGKNLRSYANACADYCRDCSAACKKHADHHAPCKACMESCDACVKACEALAA